MIRYATLNSIYEVEGPCVRRVEGENESPLPVEDGVFVEFDLVAVTNLFGDTRVLVAQSGPVVFMTSRIVAMDECDLDEEPEHCQRVFRPESRHVPAEFCEEFAMPGSEFCEACDPDVAEDRAIEREEARREEAMFE